MEINKHNYEAFFLDYHEGNLTPQQVADLLLFIEQHTELREEFENFENILLEDHTSYSFDNKDGLKREINIQNKEEYFIRSVEGTLNNAEKDLLDNFIKQHPQFLTELELFSKTKLIADEKIIFPEKDKLKRIPETADHLLISAVEGLLSKEESVLLKQQLSVDAELRQEYSLYQQTRLKPDTSIVFENKEQLKRRERKIIPLYYYASAAAAALLLLFGLYFVFNNGNKTEQKIAGNIPVQKEQILPVKENSVPANESLNNLPVKNSTASVSHKEKDSKKFNSEVITEDNLTNSENIAEDKNIAQNTPGNIVEAPQEQIIQKSTEPLTNVNPAPIAKIEKNEKAPSKEFLSLGQIAATKLKEKTLDPATLEMEKKSGRLKRLSGWDIAQIVAKGVSKVTGKKVEAKPTYNEEGEVTAYALGAGAFQISRGK
jgi:hypothetical protein